MRTPTNVNRIYPISSCLLFLCLAPLLDGAELRTITVNDPLVLGRIAEQLGRLYGQTISFEGPKFEHPDDLVNIRTCAKPTLEDLDNCGDSAVISRFCYFTARYTVDPIRDAPTNITAAVREIVAQYNAGNNPGRFAVVETIAGPSIVGIAVRGRSGAWKDVQPLLDGPITISLTNVTNMKALESVMMCVQEEAGIPIRGGSLKQPRGSVGLHAQNESARDVLARLLTDPGYGGTNNSWKLFYAPCPPAYGFEEDSTVIAPPLVDDDSVPWSMVGNVTHPDYRGEQEAAAQGSTP